MSFLRYVAFGIGSSLLVTLVACGGAGDPNGSDFGRGNGANGTGGFGNANDPTGGQGGLGNDTAGPNGDLAACATASAAAQPRPVYLVFAYDKSGSMGNDGKWGACKTAMEGFFGSKDSQGISASLTFFPSNNNICNSGNYDSPQVPITALPSNTFAQQLDKTNPNGSTPTLAALTGAMDYAKSIQGTTAKDGTVAVVMVTDGLPQSCSDDGDVGPSANLAKANAGSIKTYVVGVGDLKSNLDQIASAGGTKGAYIVSVGNPATTQAEFAKAIADIKQSALSCDYTIPPPPSGESFDRQKVNVQYTPGGGAASTLGYNADCAGGAGWHYDDANNPTRILLCDTSCSQVKAAPGKVDILFGCATQGGAVK